MAKRVRILEKRVQQAVHRLRELSGERDKLREELVTLRTEWETSAAPPDGGAEATERDPEDWTIRRREALSLIRETLSELRAD